MGNIEIFMYFYVGCVILCSVIPYIWCCYELFPTRWCYKCLRRPDQFRYPLRKPLLVDGVTLEFDNPQLQLSNLEATTLSLDNDVVITDNMYVNL